MRRTAVSWMWMNIWWNLLLADIMNQEYLCLPNDIEMYLSTTNVFNIPQ